MITNRPLSRRTLLRLGALGTFWLTGCGPLALQPGPSPTPRPTVVRWMFWGNQTNAQGYQYKAQVFMERHPTIRVETLHTPQNYWDKMQTLMAAGQAPDLFIWEPRNVAVFVTKGQIRPLDDLVSRDRYDLTDFPEKAVAQYRFRGKLWGLPRDFPTRQLFYNVDLFARQNVPRPRSDWERPDWTWEAFLEAARRLTVREAGGRASTYGFNTGRGYRQWVVWIFANGGELFNRDLTECVATQDETVTALQFLQDLIHKHRVMPEPELVQDQGYNGLFYNQRVAMYESIPALLGEHRKAIRDRFQWDVVMHPVGPGKTDRRYVCTGGGAGWAISAQTKVPEATWELLKHVVSAEMQLHSVEIGSSIGSRLSVLRSPAFLKRPPEHVELFVRGIDYLRLDPQIVRWNEVEQAMNRELDRLWAGKATGKEVARGDQAAGRPAPA